MIILYRVLIETIFKVRDVNNLYVNQIEDAICDENFLKKISKLKSISEIKEAFQKDKNIEVDKSEIEELYKTIFEFEIIDNKNNTIKISEYLTDINKENDKKNKDKYGKLKSISGGINTIPTTTRSSKWGLTTLSKLKIAIQKNVSETNI